MPEGLVIYSPNKLDGPPFAAMFSIQFLLRTLLLAYITGAQAGTRSTIVDDTDTNQINYSPQGWNQGNLCVGCAAQPDKYRAFDGTWHDGTESADRLDDLYFTFTFTGTSVEARYIAIDLIGPWTTNTNVSYSIDGIQRGVTERESTNQTEYLYNQTLFHIDGLQNVEHTLRVDLRRPGVVLFDYLIYSGDTVDVITSTSQNGSSTSTSPSPSGSSMFASDGRGTNIGAITGGILSGVFVLVAASTFWYCLRRRQKRDQAQLDAAAPVPIPIQDPPMYRIYPPAEAARRAPYKTSHAERAGARPEVEPQHTLPTYQSVHSRLVMSSGVPSDTSLVTLDTSQDPSMSALASHPLVQLQPNQFHSSTARDQIISPPMGERAEQAWRQSSETVPPPYSPIAGGEEEGTPHLLGR